MKYKNSISKYVHEYMYWHKQFNEKGSLSNHHYEFLFTNAFDVQKEFGGGSKLGCLKKPVWS